MQRSMEKNPIIGGESSGRWLKSRADERAALIAGDGCRRFSFHEPGYKSNSRTRFGLIHFISLEGYDDPCPMPRIPKKTRKNRKKPTA